MTHKEKAKKLLAAGELLSGETTTKEKLESIGHLIKGIDPELEKKYNQCVKILNNLDEALKATDVIELAADKLPGHTPEQKKRKKILLLFITAFKDLGEEVKRLRREMERSDRGEDKGNGGNKGNMMGRMGSLGRVLAFAKGPLGIVTIVAAGIVALKITSVSITIQNQGCQPITVAAYSRISLPGLSLPKAPIASGQSGTATMPPLPLTVDTFTPGRISIGTLGLQPSFPIPSGLTDIVFDGESLLEKRTVINLGANKSHQLVVQCN